MQFDGWMDMEGIGVHEVQSDHNHHMYAIHSSSLFRYLCIWICSHYRIHYGTGQGKKSETTVLNQDETDVLNASWLTLVLGLNADDHDQAIQRSPYAVIEIL